ncbi:MAG TPA: acireductone synthase [Saprospiraceae bacterium]|nr:acireductone synthase [Saprospiraceae bacterium]HMQ83608.1 acireductone synthase [Saprospiraceae bacterium]
MERRLRYILTDIEGTTTSVAFVYETLFPYFKSEIHHFLQNSANRGLVSEHLAVIATEVGIPPKASSDTFAKILINWCNADLKHGALKAIQGMVWRQAYEQGHIRGHVYADVPPAFKRWKAAGLSLGIYSSGSVAAQQLLFGYSEYSDLRPYFSDYFDTGVGHKRDVQSYENITAMLALPASTLLFLSDVTEELDAAAAAGFQTLQLLRPGTLAGDVHPIVRNFDEVDAYFG